ncbi:MAG: hypothetical protein JWN76_3302 [Chitinophagaceae bacterium]|nr:hypothetical protein [Chitinophagaceae bacterium]
MKKITLSLAILTVSLMACNNASQTNSAVSADSSGTAATEKKDEPVMTPEQQQKAWMDYMTPGDVHKMLASQDGNWTVETTMKVHPDSAEMKSTGTEVNKMILGGRYQESVFKGNMMGMPFEGRSTLGYDNAKKLFVNSWIDNMGTGVSYMEGPWDATNKTINLKGKTVDPITGKEKNMREVMTFIDDKNQKVEMYDEVNGKEFKNMVIILKKS